MNTWFRKVGMGAVALTLAGVLGGCNNGDGGGGFIRLFFGINGNGSCTSVIVDVNLEDADAVIARDEFGDVQCVINAVLDDAGCEISFSEQENGNLRAVIDDCTIPAVTNLFSCLFEDVDISELQDTASAQCSCTTENCDGTPPVCISLDPDPDSCEDCDNGEDDDGNGLEDCEDPNCENFPGCQGTTTTSTTSTTVEEPTTTSTTSTTSTSTTSTTIPDEFNCTLTFRLVDDVTLGSLQWDTDYSNAPGEMLGSAGTVECASLIEGALAAFNDKEDEELVTSGLVDLEGFTGPVNVAECTFRASIVPQADDFTVTVTEASDPELNEVVPVPEVVINNIECEGPPITTTTTLVSDTTTTTEEGPVTTTTVVGGGDFEILFSIDDAGGASVGALQLAVDYASAPGEFQDSAANVDCTSQVGGALFAPNDEDTGSDATLRLGIVSLTGFTAPAPLVECIFNGTGTPTAGDFVVTVDDATDPDGAAISVGPEDISITITPIP